MQLTGRPPWRVALAPVWHLICLFLLCTQRWVTPVHGMTDNMIAQLRQETLDVFYHGFDNYMEHAFPEDELRPLSCVPLTRDRHNPAHIEVNDVLGNYSLTLIDSLSTLAILASSPPPSAEGANQPLEDFQDGILLLVELYGDGSTGEAGRGSRSWGFDLDSKVQVFETVIRGVGGLLSAHQFAVGDLPIRGYDSTPQTKMGREGIFWSNGMVYDGQLLRLATDLANRLMPAFHTTTGLPYPRVNLRHGVPFYANSPYNNDAVYGQCDTTPRNDGHEVTETCSAGAGSLVLEFSTLSRLTGDSRYEIAAKNAFWAVWSRRTSIGLIGAGIDAETGHWVSPYTGIGAGIDSFFEYSLKSHILLSGLPYDTQHAEVDSPDSFLRAWEEAHEGIKRHIYRGAHHQHPHYIQVDVYTGAVRAFWIDSLSAFYQGLLAMAGKLEEAIETHLLYTALWTRYSAMPERWSAATGNIDSGLRWWGGRPEFIESNWYIYRATKDPWYLHVAEMVLRDIKRRCWTKCGWAGLQDVKTGELSDRMESFFLGETAKYLFLTFDPSHPLNTWDAPYVFTTEGHPLVIPKRLRPTNSRQQEEPVYDWQPAPGICPLPPVPLPFSVSATAARSDVYHAASLARLHKMPTRDTPASPLVEFTVDHPSISISDIQSPSNFTYFPWTLPPGLIPHNATSSKMEARTTFDLSFPNLPNSVQAGGLERVREGILVNSMSGIRLGMVKEPDRHPFNTELVLDDHYRIYSISNVALGRDEKVYMTRSTIDSINPVDPFFTRIRDAQSLDLIVDIPPEPVSTISSSSPTPDPLSEYMDDDASDLGNLSELQIIGLDADQEDPDGSEPSYLSNLLQSLQSLLAVPSPSPTATSLSPSQPKQTQRLYIPGTLPIGPGSAPLPDTSDPEPTYNPTNTLTWSSIYIHPDALCSERLPMDVPRTHQIIVVRRGGCSFSTKLRNIPAFPPTSSSLQLVIVVSYPEHDEPEYEWSDPNDRADNHKRGTEATSDSRRSRRSSAPAGLVQPLLDETQHTPSGLERAHPIPLIMVGGGDDTLELLRKTKGVGVKRKYHFSSQGVRISNLIVV